LVFLFQTLLNSSYKDVITYHLQSITLSGGPRSPNDKAQDSDVPDARTRVTAGCVRREEWVAAIRFVSGQLSAGGGAAPAAAPSDADDRDIAQLGTSFRDPRRIVSTNSAFHALTQ
jgi:hypothetical protein